MAKKKEEAAPEPKVSDVSATNRPMYEGDYVLSGVSWVGNKVISCNVNVPSPITIDGVFAQFKEHFATAIKDDFTVTPAEEA